LLPRSFSYARPDSLAEATRLLAAHPGARPLAGGQSLVNVMKLRAAEVEALIDISRLEELRFVRLTPQGDLEIGAGMRYRELAEHPAVAEHQPMVAEVAAGLVDVQVRTRGTIGGNLCYADPTSNFPPLAVALAATIRLSGPDAEREVPAEEFFLGPFRCDLRPGEVVRSVVLPSLADTVGVGYQSLQLAQDSWALARATAWVRGNGTVEEARVVVACIGPTPARQPAMEAALVGTRGDQASIDAAVACALEGVDAVGDSHASAEYRNEMARVYAARALRQALARTTRGDR
jgi:aerobic carbon-monoxide dehydrogenase medium subunit